MRMIINEHDNSPARLASFVFYLLRLDEMG